MYRGWTKGFQVRNDFKMECSIEVANAFQMCMTLEDNPYVDEFSYMLGNWCEDFD
jgi:hypothetical protein